MIIESNFLHFSQWYNRRAPHLKSLFLLPKNNKKVNSVICDIEYKDTLSSKTKNEIEWRFYAVLDKSFKLVTFFLLINPKT